VVEKKVSRYGFIDAIRGIAACAVMLQHSLYASKLLGDFPNARLTGFIPTWLELGETGVVAFFLVSGFVIPLSLEKTANFGLFWLHRILRIYPLYLTIFVIDLALDESDVLHNPAVLLRTIGAHLLLIQEYVHVENLVGGSWTLSLEMVWYIIISGLFLLSLNKRLNLLIAGSIAVSLVSWIICSLGHHVPMGRLSMLLCCVTGLVCYRYEQGGLSQAAFYKLLGLMGSMIVLNFAVGDVIFPARHPTSSFAMTFDSWSLAAILFFVPFATRGAEFWRHSVLAFLGCISYSVYLTHPVVLFIFALIPIHGVLLIVCTFVVTILTSIVTYRLIELPPIRFGHGRKAISEVFTPRARA
jgi:peptidoglycan/LPS O-acetylase OafA/YrhL